MENASKALLIAAAVLIAIILIAVGIKIFRSSENTVSDAGQSISEKTSQTIGFASTEISSALQSHASLNSSKEVNLGTNPYVINEYNYGEYIDLGKNVVGTNDTTDDWRILYNDKKNLYVILSDFLPNNNDVVKKCGLTRTKTYNVYSTISRDDLVGKIGKSELWKDLISDTLLAKGVIVKGAPTFDILLESYNTKYNTQNDYYNYHGLRTNPNDDTSPFDLLYINHPEEIYQGCRGYWLDSIHASQETHIANVNTSYGYISSVSFNNQARGLRPMAIIPLSNVKLNHGSANNENVWSIAQ